MSKTIVHNAVNVPIHVTDQSAIDDSIPYARDKFQVEMSRVNEHMKKFSSDLIRLYSAMVPNDSMTSQRTTTAARLLAETSQEESLSAVQDSWAAIRQSPLILNDGEHKKLKLQFDVSYFEPEEVKVQILGDCLYVKAKHEERTEDTAVLKEYKRTFTLPKGFDPEAVVSSLSRDGVLTVDVPLPQRMLELSK